VVVREQGKARQLTVDGPPNLAAALEGGRLPPHPEVRPQLGAEPGRGLVRLGPRADLVGRPLDGLQVTDGGPTLTVEGLGALRDVRPDRGQVPAYVQGTVPAGVAPGTLLPWPSTAASRRWPRWPRRAAPAPCASPACCPARRSWPAPTGWRSWPSRGAGCAGCPCGGLTARHRAGQAVSSHMLVPLSRSHSGRAAPTRSRWQAASWELQKVIRSRGLPVSRARSR
jgi:hypothetical protein